MFAIQHLNSLQEYNEGFWWSTLEEHGHGISGVQTLKFMPAILKM